MTGRGRQRLMRPVERQPMKDWLSDKLNAKEIPGLEWVNRDQKIFKIKWCHGSRHGWSLKDSVLFEKWAQHSGRFNEGDPKRWKANFRCALNSLKDVEEVKDLSVSKGQNAFRVYRMLDSRKKTDKPRVTNRRKSEPDLKYLQKDSKCVLKDRAVNASSRLASEQTAVSVKIETEDQNEPTESDSEGYQTDVQDDTRMDWSEEERVPYPVSSAEIKTEDRIPNFEKIIPGFYKVEFGKNHWLPRHGSGFKVEQLTQQTPLTPILHAFHVQLPENITTQLNAPTGNHAGLHTPHKADSTLPSATGMRSLPSATATTSSIQYAQQVRTKSGPACHVQTKAPRRFTVPADNQLADQDNSMTFPETPDGSEASHDSNSSGFIELTIYEEEVTDTPVESTDDCIVLTDLSKRYVTSSTGNTFQNIKGLEQYSTDRTGISVTPYTYNPLTPP